MCTVITKRLDLDGAAKGPEGWFTATGASVYFDHPSHAHYGHALNVDVHNRELGPTARVAVELSPSSARKLANAILAVLDSDESRLAEEGDRTAERHRARAS